MPGMMIIFYPLRACPKFLEFHLSVSSIHPHTRTVFLERERSLYIFIGPFEHFACPGRAGFLEDHKAADQDLFLRPQDLVERPSVLIYIHQISEYAAVDFV